MPRVVMQQGRDPRAGAVVVSEHDRTGWRRPIRRQVLTASVWNALIERDVDRVRLRRRLRRYEVRLTAKVGELPQRRRTTFVSVWEHAVRSGG